MKWLQVIVHASLFCGSLSSSTVCSEDRSQCYTLVTDKADQESAISRCRSDGSYLATIPNNTVVSDENDDTLAWINLNRFESSGRVKLVNGSILFAMEGSDNDGCLALDNGRLPTYECYTPLPFVCSSKYIHNCSRQSGGNCYMYVPSPMSWYRARQYCRGRYGGDLALLLASEYMDVNLTSPSWIGAYSELWKWNSTFEMNYSHWKEDEPNPDWSCAVVNIKTGLWETANCSSSHSYLCEGSHQDITTAAIAGGVIGSLIVIAGIIVLITWKLLSRQKDSRNQDPSAENTNKVIENNLPGSRGTYQEIDDVVLVVEPRNISGTYSLESATKSSKPRRFDAYEEVDIGPDLGASSSTDDYDETNIYSKEQVVLRPDVLLSTLDIDNPGTKASHKVGPKGGIYGLPVKDPNETTVVENYVYEK